MTRRPRHTAAWLAVTALLATACSSVTPSKVVEPDEVAGTEAASTLDGVTGPLVVAVGDIACPPGEATTDTTCRQADTAALTTAYSPRRVLLLGDLQYPAGSASDFAESYDATWGPLRDISKPLPGNHEYRTRRAAGYYSYFADQQPGRPGYYAYNLGSWRVYALNTNCDRIDCAAERRWMARDMNRNPRRCTAVTMHHPRFSSGKHGSNAFVRPFWRTAMRHRADVALAGHDHHYERFRKLDASGAPSRAGILSFVSGAGGKSLYPVEGRRSGSIVRYDSGFGVLAMRLAKGRYAWEFKTVDGEVLDSGVRTCR